MSIIDLGRRLTNNMEEFTRNSKSTDSLIYVDKPVQLSDGPGCFDLSVGDSWYSCNDNRYYATPAEGLTVRPRESVVVESHQVVGVPLNAFGIVTGNGKFIVQGVFLFSGKIDSGFTDKLRLGIYNGGHESITLIRETPFCTCCFFELQTNFGISRKNTSLTPLNTAPSPPLRTKIIVFMKNHWATIIGTLIAIAALVISLLK